jgi:carboxylesterase
VSPPGTGEGRRGALVLHGLSGSPESVAGLARALEEAGLEVELPLLPGHGASVDDLAASAWDDWADAAEAAFDRLAARCDAVVVVGLSMGGTLAAWLAARRPEVVGLVAVNPYVDPPAESFRELLRGIRDAGHPCLPSIGGDVADPAAWEESCDDLPIDPLLSLCAALDDVVAGLGRVTCPTLLFTSRADHVVPPVSSDVLAAGVSGPVERVWLDRSFHVATVDYDREEIERRTVEFATRGAAPETHEDGSRTPPTMAVWNASPATTSSTSPASPASP